MNGKIRREVNKILNRGENVKDSTGLLQKMMGKAAVNMVNKLNNETEILD